MHTYALRYLVHSISTCILADRSSKFKALNLHTHASQLRILYILIASVLMSACLVEHHAGDGRGTQRLLRSSLHSVSRREMVALEKW